MSYRRRLQISSAGYWYLGLTLLLGLAAMSSGNNILYLFESLLLSGLILSGILSERAISGLELEVRRKQARALEPTRDPIHLQNFRRHPAFAIEIGEWRDHQFQPLAFVPRIAGKSTIVVTSQQVLSSRGPHRWQGLAIATRFPFGFARKILLLDSPGTRLVWPAHPSHAERPESADSAAMGNQAGTAIVDGEVRPMNQDDDYRLVVWPLSVKGTGPLVRMRKSEKQAPELLLDLRAEPGEVFERKITEIARKFYGPSSMPSTSDGGSLTLLNDQGRRRVNGSKNALDLLSVVQATGEPR